MEIVTMHEIKWRASKIGYTSVLTAAKHMDILYFIISH